MHGRRKLLTRAGVGGAIVVALLLSTWSALVAAPVTHAPLAPSDYSTDYGTGGGTGSGYGTGGYGSGTCRDLYGYLGYDYLRCGAVVRRVAGTDRFATAAAISAATFPGTVDRVLLTSGADFPDALGAGPAAATLHAPVLLVGPQVLPLATTFELVRLHPSEVDIIGGTNAVSSAVESAVRDLTHATVRRIAGGNRYETAAAVAGMAFGPGVPVVYVSTGLTYADALPAGAAAANRGGALLLTAGGQLPAASLAELQRLVPSEVVVVGGSASVSSDVENAIRSLGFSVRRVTGTDRYSTSAMLAGELPFARTFLVATGTGFADALAGVAMAATAGSPILLVQPSDVPAQVSSLLQSRGAGAVTILGGFSAVSDNVEFLIGL